MVEPDVDDHAANARFGGERQDPARDRVRLVGRQVVAEVQGATAIERRQPLRPLGEAEPDGLGAARSLQRRENRADGGEGRSGDGLEGLAATVREAEARRAAVDQAEADEHLLGEHVLGQQVEHRRRVVPRHEGSYGGDDPVDRDVVDRGQPGADERVAPRCGHDVQPGREGVEPHRIDPERPRMLVVGVDRGVTVAGARERDQPHQARRRAAGARASERSL